MRFLTIFQPIILKHLHQNGFRRNNRFFWLEFIHIDICHFPHGISKTTAKGYIRNIQRIKC